jgi:hypothetical protein
LLLYHFSEDPNIKKFIPRIINGQKGNIPLVWAIDEEHSINYLFPRECPRIIYYKTENINKNDGIKFFSNTISNKIITIENKWMEIINNTILYKYTFDDKDFELYDKVAGYYISKIEIEPIKIETIKNILMEIIKNNIELWMTPNLNPLRNELIKSTIDNYSIIRFRNANLL